MLESDTETMTFAQSLALGAQHLPEYPQMAMFIARPSWSGPAATPKECAPYLQQIQETHRVSKIVFYCSLFMIGTLCLLFFFFISSTVWIMRWNRYHTIKLLAETTVKEREEHLAWYCEQYKIKLDRREDSTESEKMDELLEV